MNVEQAVQIVEFLGKYNEHFTEINDFLEQKMQKVLADDLVWLHDSLQEEQKLSMAGVSLEKKRLEILDKMGYDDYTSSELLEIFPDEYKGRFKLECTNIENSIDRIKTLNAEILETVEKKLDAADSHLKEQGVSGPGFYGAAGAKVRMTDPESDIIGKM
ncbi:MAG: flagellar protein FlgN [Oscillospiraceae bacterium]|nr:flagellar protein FlgN [Oscillospiraceae bacterium]